MTSLIRYEIRSVPQTELTLFNGWLNYGTICIKINSKPIKFLGEFRANGMKNISITDTCSARQYDELSPRVSAMLS
jgi:hypothetical protein